MNKIKLSIIIPVSKDIKLKKCLESVDVPVDVIIVLNNFPSKEVKKIALNDPNCQVICLKKTKNNLSKAFNAGIRTSKNQKILIMNSDCVFQKQQIRRIYQLLDQHDIIKTKILFDYSNYAERLVSTLRALFHEKFNSGRNLFGPGLAFNKSIKNKINGYYYDEDIAWGEDGDLTKRINLTDLDVFLDDSYIIHSPESVCHDLKTAFKIGGGKRVMDFKNQRTFIYGISSIFLENMLDKKKQFRLTFNLAGLTTVIYLLTWKMSFMLGYIFSSCKLMNK